MTIIIRHDVTIQMNHGDNKVVRCTCQHEPLGSELSVQEARALAWGHLEQENIVKGVTNDRR